MRSTYCIPLHQETAHTCECLLSAWLNGSVCPHVSHCPIGPPGALYIAANKEIVRYFLNGSSEDILISGLAEVTDIAVDYEDDMVSKLCYNYMLNR